MRTLANTSNFYSTLQTSFSREHVADLFQSAGWQVRRCSWADFEVINDWAELVLESESPMLLHGQIEDLDTHVEKVLEVLKGSHIEFRAECYGRDGSLVREISSS